MMLKRYASLASVACGLTLTLAAPALADNVSISDTGADSNQSVEINNSSNVVVTNTNVVVVQNTNVQEATSGDASAKSNTTLGGSVTSGNATNGNSTVTTVSIVNEPGVAGLPVGGSGTGVTGGSGQTGNGATGGTTGGHVLGAATAGGLGGAATLPVTGPSQPVDVSALRAAWHGQAVQAPTAVIAKGSSMFTGAMLVTATLLSLLGAVGSAWYAKRKEERV